MDEFPLDWEQDEVKSLVHRRVSRWCPTPRTMEEVAREIRAGMPAHVWMKIVVAGPRAGTKIRFSIYKFCVWVLKKIGCEIF